MNTATPRHNWTSEEVHALFALPFSDLLYQAQTVHRQHFNPNQVQFSTLHNIKKGACPEDCSYCSQSAHYKTGLQREKLLSKESVVEAAKRAKANGSTRFCMGAAWRSPPREKDFQQVIDMIAAVKSLGLETCATLGMLNESQAQRLKENGLDYYNHNLDTSERYYKEIITTRTYQDRLDTLANVRKANLKTCCGGIIDMGETLQDRVDLLITLANLPEQPLSVPINKLVRIPGTPLSDKPSINSFDFVRTVAVARLMLPKSFVRLSAGRTSMSPETQTLCFIAGANSIFYGDALLTTPNPEEDKDRQLLGMLGIEQLPYNENATKT